MKSRANIRSHPLHPILVVFPIAFFTGTLLFDLLAFFLNHVDLAQTAAHLCLAGIVFAVLAAVPGLIDFLGTVPPASSARKRAAKHGILNVAVLLLFALSAIGRNSLPLPILICIELSGVVLLSVAGWMGGTLVHRNQIGVDIRYAGAGKWKEEELQPVQGKLYLNTSDLSDSQMKLLHVHGKRLVLAKSGSTICVFEDRCPHRGGSLAAGALVNGLVQCPWHGSQFNVASGQCQAGPAKEPIRIFKVENLGDRPFISWDPSHPGSA